MAYHHVQVGWAVIVGSGVGLGVALAVTLSLSAATLATVPWLVGRGAVRLEMKNERPVMIGSDEAERRNDAIDAFVAQQGYGRQRQQS